MAFTKLKIVMLLFAAMLFNTQPARSLSQNSPNKNELVSASRQAIIETGMTGEYFDEHFSLQQFVDKPGDLRVVWKYSLNGYSATLNDGVGFYTNAKQGRVYVHSIKDLLKSTHDIKKTLSRSQATRLMTSCIGKHTGETVVFLKLSVFKYSTFYLTAHSSASARTRERDDSSRETRDQASRGSAERDKLESEDIQKPLKIGYINLETGRCTRGEAIVAP